MALISKIYFCFHNLFFQNDGIDHKSIWISYPHGWCTCEAKPTTLKRPSLGDGFENHMYVCILKILSSLSQGIHVI